MRVSKLCLYAINIAITAFVSSLCIAARADTYPTLGLSIDNRFVYGIYGSGAVVLESQIFLFGGCTPQASAFYVTYVNGLAFRGSDTPPR